MQAGGRSGANLFPGRLDQPHDDIKPDQDVLRREWAFLDCQVQRPVSPMAGRPRRLSLAKSGEFADGP
jgi:hypothetical protein